MTWSSKECDELDARDLHTQSATHEVLTPGKEKVISVEYSVSMIGQLLKVEVETYKDLTGTAKVPSVLPTSHEVQIPGIEKDAGYHRQL